MPNYVSVHVKCPFYHREFSDRILCEGLLNESSCNETYFKNAQAKIAHSKKHCRRDYTKCALYQTLEKKYE